MQVELTDALINQILYLHSKKFKPSQIHVVTEVKPSVIKRICTSKMASKKKVYNYNFRWEDYENKSVL